MTECYRCGQEGHRAAACDTWPAAAARHDPLALFRRPAREIADPHAWAEKIRRELGWPTPQKGGADDRACNT